MIWSLSSQYEENCWHSLFVFISTWASFAKWYSVTLEFSLLLFQLFFFVCIFFFNFLVNFRIQILSQLLCWIFFAILYGQILHRYDSLFFRRMGKRFSAKKKERLGEIGVQSSRWIHYEKWIKINEKENVEKEKEREFPPCFRQIPFSSI